MMIYDKVIGAKSTISLPYLLSGVAILMLADLVLRLLRARLLGSVAGRLDYLIGVETFRQSIILPVSFILDILQHNYYAQAPFLLLIAAKHHVNRHYSG